METGATKRGQTGLLGGDQGTGEEETGASNPGEIMYEYNEKDNEPKEGMENFMTKQRTKRKRKQMKQCIVHLHQLTPGTLSKIYSTGKVNLTDGSSIASSEFSKTTGSRMGDDEDDDVNVDGTKKIRKKRKRKPRIMKDFVDIATIRETSKRNLRKATKNTLNHDLSQFAKVKTPSTNQGFKEIDISSSEATMLSGKYNNYTPGPPEINNNTLKEVENPLSVASQVIEQGEGPGTMALLNTTRNQPPTPSDPVLFTKKIPKPRMTLSRSGPSSAVSGSDSDSIVDFNRFDRGLSGRSSPEDWSFDAISRMGGTSTGIKDVGIHARVPVPGVPTVPGTGASGTTHLPQYLPTPGNAPLQAATLRPSQTAAKKPQGAIQAALTTPPSPIQDGKQVWPRPTAVPKSATVTSPTGPIMNQTKPPTQATGNKSTQPATIPVTTQSKSKPPEPSEAVHQAKPPVSNVVTSVTNFIENAVSRISRSELISSEEKTKSSAGNRRALPTKPAQSAFPAAISQTVTPPVKAQRTRPTGPSVRSPTPQLTARAPQLLTARPFGQVQTTKPPGPGLQARALGVGQPPRFSVPTPVQQARMPAPVMTSPVTSTIPSAATKSSPSPISGTILAVQQARMPGPVMSSPVTSTIPSTATRPSPISGTMPAVQPPWPTTTIGQPNLSSFPHGVSSGRTQPKLAGSTQPEKPDLVNPTEPPPYTSVPVQPNPQPSKSGIVQPGILGQPQLSPRPTILKSTSQPNTSGVTQTRPSGPTPSGPRVPGPTNVTQTRPTVMTQLNPARQVQQRPPVVQPLTASRPSGDTAPNPIQPPEQPNSIQNSVAPGFTTQALSHGQLQGPRPTQASQEVAPIRYPVGVCMATSSSSGLSVTQSTAVVPQPSRFTQPTSPSTIANISRQLEPRTMELLRHLVGPHITRQAGSFLTTNLTPGILGGQASPHLIRLPPLPAGTVQVGPGPNRDCRSPTTGA